MGDLGVEGAGAVFADAQQVLVQFLAVGQAGEHDVDLAPGVADQPLGDVGDADRIAHVEDQHLTAAPHHRCLQHQQHGLGDRHEVAGDVRVGHGDRPALGDLGAEHAQHRPAAAEHVAEPHAQVAAVVAGIGLGGDPLGDALGEPEHARGVSCLVGRDVDERVNAVLLGGGEHVLGAADVRLDGLHRRLLQQRQVLERGGVEHDLGLDFGEDFVEAVGVADVGEDQLVAGQVRAAVDAQLHGVQGGFVAVE